MKNNEGIPSAEILIKIPIDQEHKQYKTYLGLVDTVTSSSLINKDIIKFSPLIWNHPKKKPNGLLKQEPSKLMEQSNLRIICYLSSPILRKL
jgi:hypothetical protein